MLLLLLNQIILPSLKVSNEIISKTLLENYLGGKKMHRIIISEKDIPRFLQIISLSPLRDFSFVVSITIE